MKYLEMIVIILALVMEYEYLIKGRQLHGKSTKEKTEIFMRGYPTIMGVIFWLGSVAYFAFALSWCFISNLPVQAAAIPLAIVSIVSIVWKNFPVWWNVVDRIVSISVLLVIGYIKFRAL